MRGSQHLFALLGLFGTTARWSFVIAGKCGRRPIKAVKIY